MNNTILLRNVTKRYGSDYALKNFSFDFPSKGVVAILGRSGSGKSTLLNIVSGMDQRFEGTALVLNRNVKLESKDDMAEFRMRNIGYVFQSFNLIELETSFDNVYFPIDALYYDEPKKKRSKAMDLLRFVGLEKKADQVVNTLSGGEKQRIAFARALVADPKILLCDEPTASLDKANAEKVFGIIRAIAAKHLVVVVTHDEELALSYADTILRIGNGELQSVEQIERGERKQPMLPTMRLRNIKATSELSSSFVFRHAGHLIKNRRIRSLISRASISAGLIGLGLSIYIATSISDEIAHAFEAIVPENEVIVEKRLRAEQPISNVYSARLNEIEYLCTKYPEDIADWGTTIAMDFESVFKDDDTFALIHGGRTITLSGFHSRQMNDYLWLDDYPDIEVYPSRPAHMDSEEVLLGLPYANMASLCFSLGILRNYEELGNFIASNNLEMLLYLSNGDIGFYNEDLFSVVGVVPTDAPCFYHLNHRWNHDYFINHLNFHSSMTEETPNLQTVLEIPYIHYSGDMSSLLAKCRNDRNVDTLIFERASESYLPTLCNAFTSCAYPRYYAFSCDRNGLGWGLMDSLWNHPLSRGGMVCSPSGFYAMTGSFLQGFAMKFFISNDAESLFGVRESASSVAKEFAARPLELPDSVLDGCYAAGSSAFRVSSNFSDLREGRAPVGVDEVAISSSLQTKFDKPSTLLISAQVSESVVGNRLVREFKDAEVKVTGVVKSNRDTIYVPSSWTVDFFCDRLQVSPFNLEPSACVICFDSNRDASSYIQEMSKAYPELVFYSPCDDASDSVSETSGYIGVVLSVFSAIALIMSSLLFSIVMVITIGENDKEAKLLHALGISSSDISRIYSGVSIHYAIQSFLASSIAILACELIAKKYISDAFSVSFSLQISWIPFVAVASFVGLFLIFMSVYVRKKANESAS